MLVNIFGQYLKWTSGVTVMGQIEGKLSIQSVKI